MAIIDDGNDHRESSPLLDTELGIESDTTTISSSNLKYLQIRLISISIFLIVLVEIGVLLQLIPFNKVLEDIICRNFHPEVIGVFGEDRDLICKDKRVQSELALVKGWAITIECIPGVLTAIPYGFAADRYGRKPILVLGLSGAVMSSLFSCAVCWWEDVFPIRLIWLSAVFLLIGGGATVFAATLLALIADVFSEEQRTTMFAYLGVAIFVGQMIGSPVTSAAMDYNPWFAIFLGIAAVILCGLMTLTLPETLNLRISKDLPSDLVPEPETSQTKANWLQTVKENVMKLGQAEVWYIWRKTAVALLLFTFVLTNLGKFLQELILQYATNRYHWTWARAGLLLSLRASCSIALLLLILPLSSYLLTTRFHISALTRDLFLARLSIFFLSLGSFIIGFASNSSLMIFGLIITTLGTGYTLLARSLLTSLVEKHHIATLYNTMAALETIGTIIAGPIMAGTFRWGLEMGGVWVGMPFLFAGAMFASAGAVIWVVRLEKAEGDIEESVGE